MMEWLFLFTCVLHLISLALPILQHRTLQIHTDTDTDTDIA